MRASAVVSGVLFNYLSTGFVTVTGFAYTAFAVHRLSHSRYGILVLVTSLVSYTSLLDLGIGLTVMKMVAERVGRGEHRELVAIIGSAVRMFTVIGLVGSGVLLCLEPFVGGIFHVAGADLGLLRVALLVTAVGVGLSFPSSIYTAVHQAHGDFRYLSILGIVVQAVQVAIGMGLLLAGQGVLALACLASGLAVVSYLLKGHHAHRKFHVSLREGRFDRSIARRMFAMSNWVFLMNIATYLIFQVDLVVAGAVLGTAAVAAYQVALGPASAIQKAGDQFNSVSLPAASSLRAREAAAELRRLLYESTRMVAAVAMPAVVLFAVWGHQLLRLWVGRSFTSSYPTLVVLGLGYLFASVNGTAATVFMALDRYRLMALLSVLEAAVNLALSIVLARHLGIVGIALGTAVPMSALVVGFYVPFACRLTGASLAGLARRIALPIAVNTAAYVTLRFTVDQARFSNLLVLGIASLAVWAACFSATVLLDPVERPTYLGMARQMMLRGRS